MNFRVVKYLLVLVTPLLVAISLSGHLWTTFLAPAVLFGLLPLMELFTQGSTENLSVVEEEMVKKDARYDLILYALVPVQYSLLAFFLFRVGDGSLSMLETIGIVLSMGMACGILGINAAHELGHRSTGYEQTMSKMLLLTSLYMHFFIEHNRGHHRHVSTDEDPASARKGEWVYAFYFRTIIGSWLSAWKLEKERLGKKGYSFWSMHNEMLRFQLIQIALLVAIAVIFDVRTMLLFMLAAFIGILLLETVNYIEHYGLRRLQVNGKYERTMPCHSWNSNHPLGRLMLLELSRHSDHHYQASRKYQILRHFDDSPQMPTGYPGMIILSLFPPLWFYVMDRQIFRYKESQQEAIPG
ncbi:MAG: alkane 1-monooxygenase [Sphingobacteriales bacterium]|jgi:alkane 1-monooxygenase